MQTEGPPARVAGDSQNSRKHCRPLRGLPLSLDYQPGVPLRSTPGFMLSPATAGWESVSTVGSLLAAQSRLFVQSRGGLEQNPARFFSAQVDAQ
jgi:hypothetical protein